MNGIKILAVLAFTSASVDSAAGDKIKVHGNDLVVNSPPGGAVLINGVDVLKELDSIATAAGDTRAMTDPPTSRPERSAHAGADASVAAKIKVLGNDLVVNAPLGGAVLINGVDVLKELERLQGEVAILAAAAAVTETTHTHTSTTHTSTTKTNTTTTITATSTTTTTTATATTTTTTTSTASTTTTTTTTVYEVEVEYLVVAGGGGGAGASGNYYGWGGGGAGGFLEGTVPINGTSVVTVGAGGAGCSNYCNGKNGKDSSIGAFVTAVGGGAGGRT